MVLPPLVHHREGARHANLVCRPDFDGVDCAGDRDLRRRAAAVEHQQPIWTGHRSRAAAGPRAKRDRSEERAAAAPIRAAPADERSRAPPEALDAVLLRLHLLCVADDLVAVRRAAAGIAEGLPGSAILRLVPGVAGGGDVFLDS